jgi:hypothetical protein
VLLLIATVVLAILLLLCKQLLLFVQELFWLNLEEGYFACQFNSSEQFLKIFRLSRLCDGVSDCFQASDELRDYLK